MLQLRAIPGPTARLLQSMLRDKGLLKGQVEGIVNYGHFPAESLPTLNARAGTVNKYEELVRMDKAGILTIPFSKDARDLDAPIFGRKLHHTRGRDIIHYRVRPMLRGETSSDYFTQVVPKAKEYRVWAFRGKALATYEKELEYAERNGRRGRNPEVWNWANGYAYHFVHPDTAPSGATSLAVAAVDALGLDFGAVDLLWGKDRHFYALEVNTAPGTQGQPRQGISSLVNCIERWAKGGFPQRG